MSLDVYLRLGSMSAEGSGIFIRENGSIREITRTEWNEKFPNREPIIVLEDYKYYVHHANITHNLSKMADKAGIYETLWRPDEIAIWHAHQLIEPLRSGLKRLQADPDYYSLFNPENGWGNYENLVEFVKQYLEACEQYPYAEVFVSR